MCLCFQAEQASAFRSEEMVSHHPIAHHTAGWQREKPLQSESKTVLLSIFLSLRVQMICVPLSVTLSVCVCRRSMRIRRETTVSRYTRADTTRRSVCPVTRVCVCVCVCIVCIMNVYICVSAARHSEGAEKHRRKLLWGATNRAQLCKNLSNTSPLNQKKKMNYVFVLSGLI